MTKRDPQELYDFIQNHKGPYGPYSTKKDYTNLKVIIKYLNNYYDHIKSYSTQLKNFMEYWDLKDIVISWFCLTLSYKTALTPSILEIKGSYFKFTTLF